MGLLQRIRQKVIDRRYFLSAHAEQEMWDDDLTRSDVERAILNGRIDKRLTHDPRGNRYRMLGRARDGRETYVVCRHHENGELIVITAYLKE